MVPGMVHTAVRPLAVAGNAAAVDGVRQDRPAAAYSARWQCARPWLWQRSRQQPGLLGITVCCHLRQSGGKAYASNGRTALHAPPLVSWLCYLACCCFRPAEVHCVVVACCFYHAARQSIGVLLLFFSGCITPPLAWLSTHCLAALGQVCVGLKCGALLPRARWRVVPLPGCCCGADSVTVREAQHCLGAVDLRPAVLPHLMLQLVCFASCCQMLLCCSVVAWVFLTAAPTWDAGPVCMCALALWCTAMSDMVPLSTPGLSCGCVAGRQSV